MKYIQSQPPLNCTPKEATRKQLQAFYEWYLLQIPIRIEYITSYIKATAGFEEWASDYTTASLSSLSRWFAGQVKIYKRSDEEMLAISNKLRFQVEFPDYDITSETLFLAFDIGMYFGEVMRINHPQLEWTLCLKSKNNHDYGSVVLTGIGKMAFNPNLICRTLSYSYAEDKNSKKNLFDIYDYWTITFACSPQAAV